MASRIVVWALCAVVGPGAQNARSQSAEVPTHRSRGSPVEGVIRTWGSPQMGGLLSLWEAGFSKLKPEVRFENDLKTTLAAAPGVYTGRAEIGVLGREIWPVESQAFTAVAGHPPLVIDVATGSFDVPKATFALMVFVQKANPIASLSVEELARVFGSDRPVRTWGELGLKGEWAQRPVHLYGFKVENDKSQIFSQLVFHEGTRWNAGLHEFGNGPGVNGADAGESIVRAVAGDPDGIGISNVHYATPDVKAIPVMGAGSNQAVPPTRDNVASRRYPLSRAVYFVLDTPQSAAVHEFLRYVLSHEGQEDVRREGNYLPLPPQVVAEQLGRLRGP